MERTVKLSGSLGLAVIVGTKAVEPFLSGWIFQKVSKGQKVPTLLQKRLTLSGSNFSFLAPKVMHFFKKTGS